MTDSHGLTVELAVEEINLLLEALDAYEYWQIGDVLPRNNGALILPDDPDGDRYWDLDRPITDVEADALEEARFCRTLSNRLTHVRNSLDP